MAHKANIRRELSRRLGYIRQYVKNVRVDFPRIRLSRNGNDFGKPEFFGDEFFKREDLFFVVEKLQKTCARAGRSFATEKFQIAELEIQPFKVFDQIVQPERRALAQSRRLRGLKMCIRKNRQTLILFGKIGYGGNSVDKQSSDFAKPFAHKQNVGVIRNVTRRRAEVNYSPRIGANVTVSINMRHYVVAEFAFVFRLFFVIYIVYMRFQLFDLSVGDIQPELLFAFCQRNPKFTPCRIAVIG